MEGLKMVKYIQALVFGLGALVAIGSVSWVTHTKLADLKDKQLAQPYEFASLKDRERQLRCMADNVYYEAGHEPAEGKLAVAQVVMNRVAHPEFPKDPCQVIYQRNVFYSKVVCQFSWYCDGSINRPINQAAWQESYNAAKMVLMEGFRLPSLNDALFYHADYVNPQWKKDQVAKIGRHIFYKPREKRDARI
jgi:spore germination cell wall hydrolase CwlJ-like protein